LRLLALVAGQLNVFGQRPTTSHAATSVAVLESGGRISFIPKSQ